MGSILRDKGKTLIECLEDENPYFHLTMQPFFVDIINIYFPSMLLQDIFLDIESITGLKKLSLDDLMFNNNVIGVDKSTGDKFLACPDKLIDLYKKGCEHNSSSHLKNMFTSDFCNNGFESMPSYCYDVELIRTPQAILIGEESSNASIDMTIFFATINREASYGVGKNGLQKIEAFLEVRDNNNSNRFTQFVINEVSRDKNDTTKGHFLISLKTSTSDELEHHVWLFPDMLRKYALELPGLFKKKLLKEDSAEKPVFEWVEDICRNNNGINAFTNKPDYLAEKDSELVTKILSCNEAKYYAKTIPEIVNRARRIYVPKDIAEQIEQLYTYLLNERKIIKYNPDLEKRSNNTIVELDMSCYFDIIKEIYNNMNTGDASKQDYNLFYRDGHGKLRFSTLYYSAQSGCLNPKKKQYGIFQAYAHRPSSSSDIEKFESFLNVINLDDPSNMFLFKIDELSKKSSTQKESAQKELYMTESFTYGNIFEHHIVIQKAYPEIAIDMPLKIRTAFGHNQYTLAPKHRDIYAMLQQN